MAFAELLHIAPAQEERLLPETVRERLEALYARVPGVVCGCDRPGQCCELTKAEMADDFATMYPLFLVEYLNIVDYVRGRFDPQQQAAFLDLREERPARCPFLTADGRCSIHPVRPLSCRTYGVLSRAQVEETAQRAKSEVPARWLWHFLSIERHTVCPHTEVLEPEKVEAHAREMVSGGYEQELIRMGREVEATDEGRREVCRKVTGLERITRWTWGGFNTLLRAPVAWLNRHFAGYWARAFLAD